MVVVFALFYAVAYAAIAALSALFFRAPWPRFGRAALTSIGILAALIAAVFGVVALSSDAELANRFQHAVGGGVLGVVLCFFVFRDQRIKASRLQFVIWSALIVTALGVGNELFEFAAQSYTGMIFADNPLDTWRDLASNTVGIALALPFAALARR